MNGLPRASGDTPDDLVQSHQVIQAAPRKWGYTAPSALRRSWLPGCPAQVGIHPRCLVFACGLVRLPRASGDTPARNKACYSASKAAPRKWGYTSPRPSTSGSAMGCPAQVGIHPYTCSGSIPFSRLPRASGDTPLANFQNFGHYAAAPRKWGYTPGTLLDGRWGGGCPAQVGIHLILSAIIQWELGLPRASGDTPCYCVIFTSSHWAAPRKWGYTLGQKKRKSSLPGCPAQVGIHPGWTAASNSLPRLPRASGDTPQAPEKEPPKHPAAPRKWGYTLENSDPNTPGDGCPAQVGIHLVALYRVGRGEWLPRASGDTPLRKPRLPATVMAAPRKWGYTPLLHFAVVPETGCPAQVGIHRIFRGL